MPASKRAREAEAELEQLTCEELRNQLIHRGLNSLGNKHWIVTRLANALADEAAHLHLAPTPSNRNMSKRQKRMAECYDPSRPSMDPATELQREVLPMILAFTGSLSTIAAAMRVSKAWYAAAQDTLLWLALFDAYKLGPECVPRAEFPAPILWFAAHYVASRLDRQLPKGSCLTESDMLRLWHGNDRQRCRYCKYAVPADSLVTRIDIGSIVHLACCVGAFPPSLPSIFHVHTYNLCRSQRVLCPDFRKNRLTLAAMDYRLLHLPYKVAVQFVRWMLCGQTAALLPDGFGVPLPTWK